MEVRRFMFAAVPAIAFVVLIGTYALMPAIGTMISILVIVLALAIPGIAVHYQKVRTKRKSVRFILDVKGTTYLVELFVIINGTIETRERFTKPQYWQAVIRIPENMSESDKMVEAAVIDCVNAAVRIYNISTSRRGVNKLRVLDDLTVKPVKA